MTPLEVGIIIERFKNIWEMKQPGDLGGLAWNQGYNFILGKAVVEQGINDPSKVAKSKVWEHYLGENYAEIMERVLGSDIEKGIA